MSLLGWSPCSPDGDLVDVPGQLTFQLSSSSTASPSESTDAEKKIPRPKNSFIIFRTEFARLHTPKANRTRRGDGKAQPVSRSVSGKASDAWNLLRPEEKQIYQRLAELEKEKHARKYPNYQYRPKRRETAPKRRRRPSPASTIRTAGSDALTLSPPSEQPPFPPDSLIANPQVKADRRRSSSVPVTSGEHMLWAAEERPENWERKKNKRRSRSVTQEWSFPPPEPVFLDPRSPQLSPTYLHTRIDALSLSSLPAHHMSPLAAVASSLAGWDGQPTPPQPMRITPLAPQPVRLNPPSWLITASTAYEPARASPELDAPLTPIATDFQWPLDPTSQYMSMHPLTEAADPRGAGSSKLGGAGDYAALQDYELGLQERVRTGDADYELFEYDELRY